MNKEKENVWEYPRPAIYKSHIGEIEVISNNIVLAKISNAISVLETSHPPTYYFPSEDVKVEFLKKNNHTSYCEWKDSANYFDLFLENIEITNIGWSYLTPNKKFLPIKSYISFYASKVEKCFVNGEQVKKQDGDFYRGWITDNLVGPFKGGPKTLDW